MRTGQRGSALLAVLWLSAALAAIAFALASTVRGETDRAATSVDDLRSYYLAQGAIQRATLYIQWGAQYRNPDGSSRYYAQGAPRLFLHFPEGEVVVDIIPETAKWNLNQARPEDIYRLLAALGTTEQQAGTVTQAIVDWRNPTRNGGLSIFDQFYMSRNPSFTARHASFEETEELLVLQGMTPDLFYGTYERTAPLEDPARPGQLVPRGGLRDCVSVFGTVGQFDINAAAPAVLASVGLAPDQVAAIVQRRSQRPFTTLDMPAVMQSFGPAGGHLRIGGNSMFTFRATARLRLPDGSLSDLRRTVSALIKLNAPASATPYQVMRWYDRG